MSGVAPAARAPHEAHVEGVAGSVGAGAGLAGSAVPAAHLRTRARRPAPAQRRVTAARPSGGSRAPCVGRPAARPSQRGAVSWHSPSAPGAAHAARDGRACARAPVLAGGLRERRQGGDERAVPGAPAGPAGGWRLRGAGRGRGLARRAAVERSVRAAVAAGARGRPLRLQPRSTCWAWVWCGAHRASLAGHPVPRPDMARQRAGNVAALLHTLTRLCADFAAAAVRLGAARCRT